ncbi:MAG: hypothetical protein ACOYWZ_20215 [Bacillota bacterium]
MATAQTIINAACRRIGIPSAGSSISNIGLETLNNMISSWSAEGLIIPYYTTENFNLTVGKSSYTIGSTTGDFNTVRPLRIINAFIRDSDNVDYPLDVTMTQQEYNDISDKTVDERPSKLYYDPQYTPLGKIYFNSEPSEVEALHLISEKPLTELAALNTEVSLPDLYKEALIYNLAIRMADDIEKEVSSQVIQIAVMSKNTVENLNALNKLMETSKMDQAITYILERG